LCWWFIIIIIVIVAFHGIITSTLATRGHGADDDLVVGSRLCPLSLSSSLSLGLLPRRLFDPSGIVRRHEMRDFRKERLSMHR
jgi:hypothetical protein